MHFRVIGLVLLGVAITALYVAGVVIVRYYDGEPERIANRNAERIANRDLNPETTED